MESLVGYGSDDDNETERYEEIEDSVGIHTGGLRRRDDDTNYDDVNMDMSEDSQDGESEPELPPAEPEPPQRDTRPGKETRRQIDGRPEPERPRDDRDSRRDDRDARREDRDIRREDREPRREEREPRREDREPRREDREPRREDRDRRRDDRRREHERDRRDKFEERHQRDRSERDRRHDGGSTRRGLLGDRPEDKPTDAKVPSLMDVRPFPETHARSHDARDAVSPRFVDRDRRDRDRERERDRETRHPRRSEERRPTDRRASPSSSDYRPSSYKVNKKLEVMEKMGLQIKTPDGSMATAQQLRQAAADPAPATKAPAYGPASARILDQVAKRKLLWANKGKSEAEEAAKWSGTRFAQDADGRQASKFMRLMGIKDPVAATPEAPDKDPIKKQEELFQAMQAQYEVARATTHTMRGVGLGFQRGQY